MYFKMTRSLLQKERYNSNVFKNIFALSNLITKTPLHQSLRILMQISLKCPPIVITFSPQGDLRTHTSPLFSILYSLQYYYKCNLNEKIQFLYCFLASDCLKNMKNILVFSCKSFVLCNILKIYIDT